MRSSGGETGRFKGPEGEGIWHSGKGELVLMEVGEQREPASDERKGLKDRKKWKDSQPGQRCPEMNLGR